MSAAAPTIITHATEQSQHYNNYNYRSTTSNPLQNRSSGRTTESSKNNDIGNSSPALQKDTPTTTRKSCQHKQQHEHDEDYIIRTPTFTTNSINNNYKNNEQCLRRINSSSNNIDAVIHDQNHIHIHTKKQWRHDYMHKHNYCGPAHPLILPFNEEQLLHYILPLISFLFMLTIMDVLQSILKSMKTKRNRKKMKQRQIYVKLRTYIEARRWEDLVSELQAMHCNDNTNKNKNKNKTNGINLARLTHDLSTDNDFDNARQMTILHWACRRRPTPEVLQAIITADPSAVMRTNKWSWLPLHVACINDIGVDALKVLVEANSDSVRRLSDNGWSALHFLCVQPQPRMDMPHHGDEEEGEEDEYEDNNEAALRCQCLLEVYPEACAIQNNEGLTPLMVAAESTMSSSSSSIRSAAAATHRSRSVEVLQCLLNATACSNNATVHAAALRARDKEGNTALHYAAKSPTQHYDALRLLIHADPDTVWMRNVYGVTPLNAMWNAYWNTATATDAGEEQIQEVKCCEDIMCNSDLQMLWQKSELFLRAIHDHQYPHSHSNSHSNTHANNINNKEKNNADTPPPFRVLHSIVASWPYPKEMLRIGMIIVQGKGSNANNDDDMVGEQDEQGRLPLHILVSSYAAYHHKSSFVHHHDHDHATATADDYNHNLDSICIKDEVERLLKSYPDAASVRDRGGNLALTLAIGGGLLWCNGIESIVRAYPDALRMRCCSHGNVDVDYDYDYDGLFPFQMAACQPICTIVQQDDAANDGLFHRADNNVDVLQLSTIFELLRLCPDVVA